MNHLVTRDVPQDPAVRAIVEKWVAKAAGPGNRVVGSIAADIKRATNSSGKEDRGAESPLSNLIADAQRTSTGVADGLHEPRWGPRRSAGRQLAGRRGAGQITYREPFNVQPFSNILQTFDMTGAQIDAAARAAVVHGPARWCRGAAARASARASPTRGRRARRTAARSTRRRSSWTASTLDPAKTYRVTANNFMADGGDSYTALVNGAPRTGGKVDLDALVDYFGAHPGCRRRRRRASTQVP